MRPDKGCLKRLIHDAQLALGDVAEMDGRVLYSSIDTLCSGKHYLLGLNPGGGMDRYNNVGDSLRDMPNHTRNTYIDDYWGRGAYVQQRVCFMLRSLGLEPRSVFATNLVFARSKTWTPAQARLIPACLRVHRLFLEIIQPKIVLTYGKDAFEALLKDNPHSEVPDFDTGCPNGSYNYFCRASDVDLFGRSTRLICLPHFSKFKIDAQPRTIQWLKDMAAV